MKLIDYIKGLRKGKDAHRVEYDAMSDPFLADAIEGFDSVVGDHARRIAQMQATITSKTMKKKGNAGIWKITAAAVILVAVVAGYFSLMNHESSMMVASCDNCFIDIYAPEDYIQKKRLELTLQQEVDPNAQATAIVNIENLKEVITPVERMSVYIPGNYTYNSNNRDEERELASYERNKANKNKKYEIVEATCTEIYVSEPIELSASIDNLPEVSSPVSSKNTPTDTRALALDNTITRGKIVDEMGDPIIGAAVLEKGTSNGTMTDIDGFFFIKTDSESAPLIATYLGYETVEIPDPSKTKVVALKPNNNALTEVAAVAYGARKKKDISGSVSSISAGSLQTSKQLSKPIIGEREYQKYLKKNQVRKNGKCEDIAGKVILEFTIDINNRPQNIKVIKSLCDELDNDAIRLLESGSDWTSSTLKVKLEVSY